MEGDHCLNEQHSQSTDNLKNHLDFSPINIIAKKIMRGREKDPLGISNGSEKRITEYNSACSLQDRNIDGWDHRYIFSSNANQKKNGDSTVLTVFVLTAVKFRDALSYEPKMLLSQK